MRYLYCNKPAVYFWYNILWYLVYHIKPLCSIIMHYKLFLNNDGFQNSLNSIVMYSCSCNLQFCYETYGAVMSWAKFAMGRKLPQFTYFMKCWYFNNIYEELQYIKYFYAWCIFCLNPFYTHSMTQCIILQRLREIGTVDVDWIQQVNERVQR